MFPNKITIPTAVKETSKMALRPRHITTSNWMELQVPLCMELVPDSKIHNLEHTLFSRLEPLQKPPMGTAEFRNRVFWVPMRTIFPGWNDFITDTPHVFQDGSASIITRVPNILNSAFFELLISAGVSTTATATAYDFKYQKTTSQPDEIEYRKFTKYGRFVYKTLRSLGYAPVMNASYNQSYSAMPLLALIKVFIDWYYPAQYANDDMTNEVIRLLTNNNPIDYTNGYIGSYILGKIFLVLYEVCYDKDYFTSAWDNPTGPNDGLSTAFTITDITNGSSAGASRVVSNATSDNAFVTAGTPYIRTSNFTELSAVTQYALTALRSLSDYLKRHQLVGSRALDRYLSRWGVQLSSEKLNRSVLVKSYYQAIKFGDVTSTSSTDTASLGDYAGKGISLQTNSLDFDTGKEYGFLIVLTTIQPNIDYYQGINRHVLHESKLDFYTPEFDALGVQAIAKQEVYSPISPIFGSDLDELSHGVFGFTPRYAEYKKHTSLITGDYVLGSRNVGDDAWTLFRDLSKDNFGFDTNMINVVHDYDFCVGKDKEQYNRIFQLVDDSRDKFNISHEFNISMSFPGKPLFDTYEFDDEDKSPKVTVEQNGTTVN